MEPRGNYVPLYKAIESHGLKVKGDIRLQSLIKVKAGEILDYKSRSLKSNAFFVIKLLAYDELTHILKTKGFDVDGVEYNSFISDWFTTNNVTDYIINEKINYEALESDLLEDLRKKELLPLRSVLTPEPSTKELYPDINKDDESPYESKKMGLITTNNINLGKTYLFVDSFFSQSEGDNINTTFINNIGNSEKYDFRVRSTTSVLENLKSVKVSDVLLPLPNNLVLEEDDIVKMEILEIGMLTHKEYPDLHHMFQFKVSPLKNRLLLTPLNNKFILSNYASAITSLTFKFWYQNCLLTFNDVFNVAGITPGNPTVLNTIAHGLLTGDKITTYDIITDPSFLNNSFTSHSVTVLDSNSFSINIDTTLLISPLILKYYSAKNKFEFLLDFICL